MHTYQQHVVSAKRTISGLRQHRIRYLLAATKSSFYDADGESRCIAKVPYHADFRASIVELDSAHDHGLLLFRNPETGK